MTKLELPDHEARLLVYLLKRARAEFENHGCNDLDLREALGLTQGQATGLAPQLRGAMIEAGILEDEQGSSQSVYFTDTGLMAYLEDKVQAALSIKGGAGGGA